MASATGFADNYNSNPFFRTEVNIVGLQLAKLLFLLTVIGLTATAMYGDVSLAVSNGIRAALLPHAYPDAISLSVIDQIASMRSRAVFVSATAIVIVTVVFSYIITRLALAPVRNALESQKQFIGNVAHELRTPIAIIKTNTEVSLMAEEVSPNLKKVLESTIEELDRTSEIINNLLSLSASMRPEKVEFTDVDLGTVVEQTMGKMRKLSDPKQLEIELRMSERRVVLGNAVALEQIVTNILKNAITHTSRRGRILIAIEPVHPNYIEFTIRDSGVGIARKDLFRIFEPYYRADPSRNRSGGGSGLGLTIVSELVKLHGGKISLRSAEGRGTTVIVLLPAGRRVGPGFDEVVDRQLENASEIALDFSQSESVSRSNKI